VIEVAPTRPQEAAPTAPASGYTSLVITSPGHNGTIHSNTGAFEVGAEVRPALRAAQGDVMRARLDGIPLAQSYASANFRVTEADWRAAANPDNVEHTLQVAVVDGSGTVLIESAPIRFYAHRATVRRTTR